MSGTSERVGTTGATRLKFKLPRWNQIGKALGGRRIRLVSGIVLFAYVTTHLFNHAMGNISVDAMESGVMWFEWMWRNPVSLTALYASLLAHGALGFVALYQRRSFRYKAMEMSQLALGLLIPLVLLIHIVSIRFALTLHGTHKTYAQELFQFWVTAPYLGILQALLLIVAWVHGCIGIYFWLRLERWFTTPWRMVMLAFAVAIPLLALLGFYQGGRTVTALAQQHEWRDAHATSLEVGTREERQQLLTIRYALLATYLAIFAGVLAARFWRSASERRRGLVSLTYPDRTTLRVPKGLSILEASTLYEMPHAGFCGGRGRCGTCRVTIVSGGENVPPPSAIESKLLARIRASSPNIRLACQVRPTGDVAFVPMLPPHVGSSFVLGRRRPQAGQARDVVCMFVEMRDISAHDRGHGKVLDLVFLANRFLDAAVRAVQEAGGQPNRLYGHGMMALFGLDKTLPEASRQALEAIAMLRINVDHLNSVFEKDLKIPVAFVVGLDAGEATLGDVGHEDKVEFSAVGSVVRNAAHLLDLARLTPCEVMISEAVCSAAGLPPAALTRRDVVLPGTDHSLVARSADDAAALFGALDAIIDAATRRRDPPPNARLAPA